MAARPTWIGGQQGCRLGCRQRRNQEGNRSCCYVGLFFDFALIFIRIFIGFQVVLFIFGFAWSLFWSYGG
jgi:hypothetical protein